MRTLKTFFHTLPEPAKQRIRRLLKLRLAHLPIRRKTPISRDWGMDRGKPIDRHFIDRFISDNKGCIRGAVLEVRDPGYSQRFGGAEVTRVDVLDINPGNPRATVIGDLQHLDGVGNETYDCIILTQTLQYIPDLPAAMRETSRILKPRGNLLITVPYIARLDARNAIDDLWRFTPAALRLLLKPHFADDQVAIFAPGNVLVATAFLIGLAQEELRPLDFRDNDPDYPLIVAARATKQ